MSIFLGLTAFAREIRIFKGKMHMGDEKPIIRFMFARLNEAFVSLSEEEKADFMRRDRENLDALGMKLLTMVNCDLSDEEWEFIGVEEWPSMEAIKLREKFEEDELEISKNTEYKIILGTPESFDTYGKS